MNREMDMDREMAVVMDGTGEKDMAMAWELDTVKEMEKVTSMDGDGAIRIYLVKTR